MAKCHVINSTLAGYKTILITRSKTKSNNNLPVKAKGVINLPLGKQKNEIVATPVQQKNACMDFALQTGTKKSSATF